MFGFLKQKGKDSLNFSPLDNKTIAGYNAFRPLGKQELLCYVPFSSLTFSWQGKVYACSYNRQVIVGNYPENSVREIWFGDKLQKLREHVEHDDLNYGCQHCKYFIERGKYSGIKPLLFDKYADYKNYQYPKVLEFELSNKCNLECIMCNGHVSSSIRQNREKLPPLPMPYDDIFVGQLREFIPHLVEAKFFGGEPFLIHSYYQIMDLMMELNPSINIFIITNGTILTEKVKSLLNKGDFNLAVSIDSIQKQNYEYIRKNSSFEQVMSNLEYFNEYSKSRGKILSLSFTTQRDNWHELPDVVRFCNKRGILLYNSFLKDPVELSLINKPSKELNDIWAFLSSFDLPDSNDLEQKNKKVYADYIKYISQYQIQNREKEIRGEEIISDAPLTDSPVQN